MKLFKELVSEANAWSEKIVRFEAFTATNSFTFSVPLLHAQTPGHPPTYNLTFFYLRKI